MPSNIRIKFFLCISLWIAGAAWGGDEFTLYEVRHRKAEELIEIAEKLFPGTRLSHLDGKIIVHGTPSESGRVFKLFEELDRKPRLFEITLRRKSHLRDQRSQTRAYGRVRKGDIAFEKQGEAHSRGGRVELGGVAVERDSSHKEKLDDKSETVRVLDGKEARLATGNLFFPSGVWVKPRTNGPKQVELELFSKNAAGVRVQSVSTTVQVPIGRWFSIAGAVRDSNSTGTEILSASDTRSRKDFEFEVLVKEVP